MRISDWSSDVCSSDLWLDPATKGVVKNRAGDVKEVRAVDDYTVEYELTQPYSELLYQMTQHFHTIINIDQVKERSEERRVGKECFSPCKTRWSPNHLTKNNSYSYKHFIFSLYF